MATGSLSTRRLFVPLVIVMLISVGCSSFTMPLPGGNSVATVKIQSIPLKIALAAGGAALQVAIEEFAGVKIDVKDLMQQVAIEDVKTGIPPTDIPILMVVNKQTNDILYWRLTDKVKMIRLRHDRPGGIELKVINESPLRIELWIEGNIEEVSIAVEMKE
jgi:hypothetical protein